MGDKKITTKVEEILIQPTGSIEEHMISTAQNLVVALDNLIDKVNLKNSVELEAAKAKVLIIIKQAMNSPTSPNVEYLSNQLQALLKEVFSQVSGNVNSKIKDLIALNDDMKKLKERISQAIKRKRTPGL